MALQHKPATCHAALYTSVLLRPGIQSRSQVAQSIPPPRPLMPHKRETCRLTLPIGTLGLAEGRHTYTQYTPW